MTIDQELIEMAMDTRRLQLVQRLALQLYEAREALRKIMEEDGPGLDGSPAGPCHKIAQEYLDGK